MSSQKFLRSAAAVAMFVVAACGDDDAAAPDTDAPATGSGAGTDAVEVIAQDIAFGADSYQASAGEVSFSYVNEGNILHTLVVEDVGGLELMVRSSGDTDSGSVELDAGEYTLFCDVPGHRQAGMQAALTVS